jgi:S1-C subfamily serine protease
MRILLSHLLIVASLGQCSAADFFSSPADRALADAEAGLRATKHDYDDSRLRTFASAMLSIYGSPNIFSPTDASALHVFDGAAINYNFPADILLALAERDSGFNPLARSIERGSLRRGIIKLTDDDVDREGVNPYLPDQAIYAAAKKLRGYLDGGMSIQDAIRAHFVGPVHAKWGADADDYVSDIMARAQRFAETYYGVQHTSQSEAPLVGSEIGAQMSGAGSQLPGKLPVQRMQKSQQSAVPASFAGTGFFVSQTGDVVTNSHVVENCSSISVKSDGGAVASATVIARDEAADLALLRIDTRRSAVARLRISIRLGESVAAFGYPHTGILASSGNFTLGNVTATSGLRDDNSRMQISAPVQHGNSGGPLMDAAGNVVGVVSSKLNAVKMAALEGDLPQNVNFAIKASVLATFLDVNRVAYARVADIAIPLAAPELADAARSISAFIVCAQKSMD